MAKENGYCIVKDGLIPPLPSFFAGQKLFSHSQLSLPKRASLPAGWGQHPAYEPDPLFRCIVWAAAKTQAETHQELKIKIWVGLIFQDTNLVKLQVLFTYYVERKPKKNIG